MPMPVAHMLMACNQVFSADCLLYAHLIVEAKHVHVAAAAASLLAGVNSSLHISAAAMVGPALHQV